MPARGKPPRKRPARAAPPRAEVGDPFAEALQRKVGQALREAELADHLVAYVSPARSEAYVVRGFRRELKRTWPDLAPDHVLEFPSSRALAAFTAEMPPEEGDERTYIRAECKDARSLCYASECEQLAGAKIWIKDLDIYTPFKQCVRNLELPKEKECTEVYRKTCTRVYYKDSQCTQEDFRFEQFEWVCK